MGKGREYSDDEKAAAMAALAAQGGDIGATARSLGIPAKTLRNWSKGQHLSPLASATAVIKKARLSDAIEDVLWFFLPHFEKKVPEASMGSLATAFGILTDKMRLLRGEAININQQVATPEDAQAKVRELAERARARRAQQQSTGTDTVIPFPGLNTPQEDPACSAEPSSSD